MTLGPPGVFWDSVPKSKTQCLLRHLSQHRGLLGVLSRHTEVEYFNSLAVESLCVPGPGLLSRSNWVKEKTSELVSSLQG